MVATRLVHLLGNVDPEQRRLWAARILVASVVGWLVSHALLVAFDESSFFNHTVMCISWLAITFTCWDIVLTSDVKVDTADTTG